MFEIFPRALMLIGGVIAVGGPLFALVVMAQALSRPGTKGWEAEAAGRRVASVSLIGLALMAGGSIMGLSIQGALVVSDKGWATADPALLGQLLVGTWYGHAWLLRAGAMGAMAGILGAIRARSNGRGLWGAALAVGIVALGTISLTSHAGAQPRGLLAAVTSDGFHLVAAAGWIGALVHLRVMARLADREGLSGGPAALARMVRRFSWLALASFAVLLASGVYNATWNLAAFGELASTPYGLTLVAKMLLLLPVAGIGAYNFLVMRPALAAGGRGNGPDMVGHPVARFEALVETEVVVGFAMLFVVGALTVLPQPAGNPEDVVALSRVADLFRPRAPHLVSPPPPGPNVAGARSADDIAYSEYNHHWAGTLVTLSGLLALLAALGTRRFRWAAAWPLLFMLLDVFLFFRNDPEVWPIGKVGFLESFTSHEVTEHRIALLLVAALAWIEWAGRTGRLRRRALSYIFPGLCLLGSLFLFHHNHGSVLNAPGTESLINIQHVLMGTLGVFIGISRWLELRLGDRGRPFGKIWPVLLILIGLQLTFFYREF